jgi:hypothetical protein
MRMRSEKKGIELRDKGSKVEWIEKGLSQRHSVVS